MKIKAPGGDKLRERVNAMWDEWNDETVRLIAANGIEDPYLLVLVAKSEPPDGRHAAARCEVAHRNSNNQFEEFKTSLASLDLQSATQKRFLEIVQAYGEAKESAGYLGAWLELLAADQLFNTSKSRTSGETRKANSARTKRLKRLVELIMDRGYKHETNYSIAEKRFDEIRHLFERGHGDYFDAKTVYRDVGEALRRIREI